ASPHKAAPGREPDHDPNHEERREGERLWDFRNEVGRRAAAEINHKRRGGPDNGANRAAGEPAEADRDEKRRPDGPARGAAEPQQAELAPLVEQKEVREIAEEHAGDEEERQ